MPSIPELLASVPLLRELDPQDLDRIAAASRVRCFRQGERVFEIGEPGHSLFIITEGTVQVMHPTRDSTVELAQFGPGDFFGEMALLNDSPRSATVQAICDVEALVVDKADFRELVVDRPDVALKLLEVMSVRTRNADHQISGLIDQTVRDPLTGLRNKRALDERLSEEIARSRRYGGVFSLVVIDLDDFGSVNLAVGQEGGDEILSWVGRVLSEHTRASDVPFRLERNLFAILCPWAPARIGGTIADRLAGLIREAKPPIGGELRLRPTAAAATCPDHGQDAQALYHQAQRAVLVAKSRLG